MVEGFVGIRFVCSVVFWFKFKTAGLFLFYLFLLTAFSFLWWKDISREGFRFGKHPTRVQDLLKRGMGLFIFREVLFFMAWFWAFFHNRGVPSQEVGLIWPPVGVESLNPLDVPLLNTLILLTRGITVTVAHHNIISNFSFKEEMVFTVVLGGMFTVVQGIEYFSTQFSVLSRSYGSSFFVTTGFHGVHVIIGTVFLSFVLFRRLKNQFSFDHMMGVDFSIWYWHFVDVVWLFLFSFIYCWRV